MGVKIKRQGELAGWSVGSWMDRVGSAAVPRFPLRYLDAPPASSQGTFRIAERVVGTRTGQTEIRKEGEGLNVTQDRVQAISPRCRSRRVSVEQNALQACRKLRFGVFQKHSSAWKLIGEVLRAVKRGMDAGSSVQFSGQWSSTHGHVVSCLGLRVAPGP